MLRLLLSFRSKRVAIVADIEKTFLQIFIDNQDRDYLRSFWYKVAPTVDGDLPPLEVWRMTRVPFGATCSTFLLAATIQHHLQSLALECPWTTSKLRDNFYVDDLVTGADDYPQALQLFKRTIQIFDKAGLPVRKWITNEPALQKQFEEQGLSRATTLSVNVLVVTWRTTTDDLCCALSSVSEFLKSSPCTKRQVLRAVSRIFDPFGFLVPFTISAKILFQRLWEEKASWDTHLGPEHSTAWQGWCSEIPKLQNFSVPRLLDPDVSTNFESFDLHTFCNASPLAYGAVVYLRNPDTTRTSFVVAKSRVAPLKRQTLLRLELLVALLSSSLIQTASAVFNIPRSQCHAWTDSMIALSWIRTTPTNLPPFVSNRVIEIQRYVPPDLWRHCPGHQNPADLLSRGITATQLLRNHAWLSGPQWLHQPPALWPLEPSSLGSSTQSLEPLCSCPEEISVLHTHVSSQPLLTLLDYSSYMRVITVTAWIFRLVRRCQRSPTAPDRRSLSPYHLTNNK
ncbi:uncharacterized protein LOC135395733 [Ornithodoros turicata]|uniref:uncharacterized protein LOC135395733 n=1 Tax=Ornithodoros turicata TaxID=34597 RepID=UPI0031399A0D